MARKQVLKVNRTISIIPADGPRFRSVIQDVQRSDFFILAPEERPKLAPGEEVAAMLIGPDACYHFLTEVLSYQAGPPPVYCLRYPAACQRLQNRKHVRALVALEVPYVLADGFGKGIMVDLSSGGGQLVLRQELPPGTLLTLQLSLPGGEAMEIEAQVQRTVSRPIEGDQLWAVGVVFRGLDEHSEDRIVAFVLQRLLRERRQLRGGDGDR
ncbi:MAG TPA: flagellar brake protein [Firmicutes bacterium]|jgi:c-di-GMP-binding flagellar brake protein YcgR|nr:flagellar brake protein [Bacillota bacterium]